MIAVFFVAVIISTATMLGNPTPAPKCKAAPKPGLVCPYGVEK